LYKHLSDCGQYSLDIEALLAVAYHLSDESLMAGVLLASTPAGLPCRQTGEPERPFFGGTGDENCRRSFLLKKRIGD